MAGAMRKSAIDVGANCPAPVGGAQLRPSTARRLEKLSELVAELSVRDMGLAAIAAFLGCSPSSARNYVFELQDAGVVESPASRAPPGCVERTVYRLHADTPGVRRDAGRLRADPLAGLCERAPRRDPLVAALFGAPL